jgi:RNA polymerase sigma-70 factor (ECF subfamily)
LLTPDRRVPKPDPSDDDLWLRAGLGDAEAFAVLFERHSQSIYNFCFRRTADWFVSEDLLSIVFLEAWRTREKSLSPGMVRAWLYGIATFVVRNRRRTERRYRHALARFPRESTSPDFAPDVDERLADQSRMGALLERLRMLPPREQDVLALCVWSELTYEEAAVALGVPVGTVRSRLSRARSRLRELAETSGHVARERVSTPRRSL